MSCCCGRLAEKQVQSIKIIPQWMENNPANLFSVSLSVEGSKPPPSPPPPPGSDLSFDNFYKDVIGLDGCVGSPRN